MPVRKIITECIAASTDVAAKQLDSSKRKKGTFLSNFLIFFILFTYCCLISYRVYNEMQEEFKVTEEESKKCLVDFQKKNCNALKLDGDCSQLYNCVQKEKEVGIVIKSWSLITIGINEVH